MEPDWRGFNWTGLDQIAHFIFHIAYCIFAFALLASSGRGRVGKLTYVLYCVLVGDGMGDDCDCDMI